jgi:hypothetical protein
VYVKSSITVSDKPERQKAQIGDAITTIYGPSKIGKSTLASYFPSSLYVFTEPGGRFLKVRSVKVDGKPVVESWDAFKDAIKALGKDKCQTIVIDTVDRLYQLCFDAVCADLNIEHPGEMAHGKAWNRIRLEWDEWMTRLCNLGKGVLFLSHSSERTYSSPEGDETKTSFSIPKTGYDIINALSDFIFFYYYKKVKVVGADGRKKTARVRALFCKPTADIDAGDRTGLFPETIKMPAGRAAFDALHNTFESVRSQMVKASQE